MQVRDDIADVLVEEASSALRHAATVPAKSPNTAKDSAEKTSKSAFPSTWSAESSIQLVPAKHSDTTDRSLFRRAHLASFDPDGYLQERGLRRPLFYKSGHLTCTKCNGLTFIDASALRSILELRALETSTGRIRPECLPPCVGCGETAGLRVGAHDFLSLIEG
eukprot:jgi/Undpi1/11402/HiC_scaffold_30.g13699.m1